MDVKKNMKAARKRLKKRFKVKNDILYNLVLFVLTLIMLAFGVLIARNQTNLYG